MTEIEKPAGLTPELEIATKHLWDAGHRMAMQLAPLSREEREEALAKAAQYLVEGTVQNGGPKEFGEKLAKLQVEVIRGALEKIDASGGSKGGNA